MAHSEFQVRLQIKRPAVAREQLQRLKRMFISSNVHVNLKTQDYKNQRNIKPPKETRDVPDTYQKKGGVQNDEPRVLSKHPKALRSFMQLQENEKYL